MTSSDGAPDYVEGSRTLNDFASGNVQVKDGTQNDEQSDVLHNTVDMHLGKMLSR